MRSKAPPPMGKRGAMQFRRDGARRSSRTGATELSETRARRGGGLGNADPRSDCCSSGNIRTATEE